MLGTPLTSRCGSPLDPQVQHGCPSRLHSSRAILCGRTKSTYEARSTAARARG
jgi:hypothetical protein